MIRPLATTALFLLALTTARADAQGLSASLDSTMQAAERGGFSGVVRVERGGTTLLEKGYGAANRAEHVPFTTSTVVQIGSNTKDFTAVAMLQLQETGRLSMSDSLAKYFPSAPADKRNITIRQLMNHRAGFPAGIGGDFEPIGRAALVERAMKTPLLFAPGSRESYSNTGYSLLASIIEQVTGKSYDGYVRDAILAPLGLHHTGFLLPAFRVNELAHGYMAAGTDNGTMLAKAHADDGPYWNLRGNGGMLSTAGDMHAFYKELFEGSRLMTPATRALWFNPDEPIGLAGSDGVNFFLYERFPRMRTEIIIASTNAAMQAPKIRREVGKVLGLPDPGGDPGDNVAPRKGGTPAPAALASMLADYVKILNTDDTTRLRTFLGAHFASGADEPSVDDRMTRMARMREALGTLTIEKLELFDDGIEMRTTSSVQGLVIVHVSADRTAPYLIHGVQVRIGG